ncbi:ScbR family autoregulator-binding transcription factor [Gordonia shandongensis]|uniref:ScbR family autoregulator-binding transcription factor n=1 Tax=Gordonia shandongensis TaxID=376351 RepID=UPI00042A5C75|nr:ScbR family autoregulator-binding transcription factor [Gordonia shandongensis]
MAKQARAVATRGQILDGAARVFGRLGFERARLNDIVDETGVTRGALYFHFQSKDELARIVIDEQHARSRALIDRVTATDADAITTIVELTREFARLAADDPVIRAGIGLILEFNRGEQPIPAYLDWIEASRRLVTRAIAEGDVRPEVVPADAAEFIIGSFVGVQLSSQIVAGGVDLLDRVDRLIGFILPALMRPERFAAHPATVG